MEDDNFERKFKLRLLNAHLTCYICNGYLIDAVTVTECLHSFCRSCLVKHLEENTICPKCEQLIHQSHPLQYVSNDRAIQTLVFDLVPELKKVEIERRIKFHKDRGLSYEPEEGNIVDDGKTITASKDSAKVDDPEFHRNDDQVSVRLVSGSSGLRQKQRQFVRCSSQATITNLKKYIAKRIYKNHHRIDIFCDNELMGRDHTLKFILKTRWRSKNEPLELQYRRHIDL